MTKHSFGYNYLCGTCESPPAILIGLATHTLPCGSICVAKPSREADQLTYVLVGQPPVTQQCPCNNFFSGAVDSKRSFNNYVVTILPNFDPLTLEWTKIYILHTTGGSPLVRFILKYGFVTKSLRKDETLTS